jgi:hypothetical protein
MKMPVHDLPQLKYFAGMKMMNSMMDFNGNIKDMGMKMSNQVMDMNEVMYPEITGPEKEAKTMSDSAVTSHSHSHRKEIVTLNYTMLKSVVNTTLPAGPVKNFTFRLTGNMNRYIWTINNIALSDTDKIFIKKGENVRMVLINESMMRHPMHLHGHEFRLINGQGEHSPLKNVLDIMPMETDTIEFAARYDGDWFFHCHLLYHMMAGMGRVFRYVNSPPNEQVDTIKNAWKIFSREDRMFHFSGSVAVHSQLISPVVMLMNRYYLAEAMADINYEGEYESEIKFSRYFGRNYFGKVFAGADLRGIKDEHQDDDDIVRETEKRKVAIFGVEYTLPFFLQSEIRIDHTGQVRFQIGRHDLPLSSRLRAEGYWNTDKEYEIGFNYIITKRLRLSANYDSHFGGGGGITFTY